MWLSRVAFLAPLLAAFFIGGCTVSPIKSAPNGNQVLPWRGRLAVRIAADPPNSQVQSFAAGFELSGSAQAGELTLLTPLGTTAAALSWSAQAAVLRSNGEVRHFESLEALIKQALGSEIPVTALFAWLAGDNLEVAGWSADLSLYASGRIVARRMTPAPPTELLVLLD